MEGAAANALADPVPDDVREERRSRFMATQAKISKARLKRKVGQRMSVLVDAIEADGTAIARSAADAPEIDGVVRIAKPGAARVGDFVDVEIVRSTEHDLVGKPVA